MSFPPEISCPTCGNPCDDKPICRQCGVDLRLLQTVNTLPDVWFNRALGALEEGNVEKALEWVAACCVARPADAPAHRLRAFLWAQLGRVDAARASLEQARLLEPAAVQVCEVEEFIVARGREIRKKPVSPKKSEKARKRGKPRHSE